MNVPKIEFCVIEEKRYRRILLIRNGYNRYSGKSIVYALNKLPLRKYKKYIYDILYTPDHKAVYYCIPLNTIKKDIDTVLESAQVVYSI